MENAIATTLPEDETLWDAVLQRDAAADGRFVFAVKSTGIYCRPSCPSRHPRRERVAFYAAPPQAEAAGYRACLRCAPKAPSLQERERALVRRACAWLEKEGEETTGRVARLAGELAVPTRTLQRAFARQLGVSPRQYADAHRQGRARTSLRGEATVTDALYDAGYGSASRFYEGVQERIGMTPGAYRRGGAGVRLSYAFSASVLGRVLVAATERGIAAVRLGDDDGVLEAELRDEFPQAELVQDAEGIGKWVTAVLAVLEGSRPALGLPMDVQATAFQHRVWETLRRIPWGQTRTYAEVAASLGQPLAARAVARACATNPVALVVPCHRVVGAGGRLAGYRWGLPRKERLLAREAEELDTRARRPRKSSR